MRKRNLQEGAGAAEAAGAVVAAVAVPMIMAALRSRTVRVSTLTSTSLRSTTWYMKSIRSHYLRFILITMTIPVGEEAVVEAEVAVAVVVAIIMTRVMLIPDLKQRLSKMQRRARMTCRL
jgi:NhaP-type Na+/H+ or K+/H+ antiporter